MRATWFERPRSPVFLCMLDDLMPEHDVQAVASELDFELGEVARVQATEDSVLLRISGRWWSAREVSLPTPLLTVGRGRFARRLTPLPDAEGAEPAAGPS